jgi:hypothetical protein
MTAGQLQRAQVPALIDNAAEWPAIAKQIAEASGLPTVLTPEVLTAMVGSAVPLLFEADATKDTGLLRGTFSDAVIAQWQRHLGALGSKRPQSVSIQLVGAHMVGPHAVLRAHLSIDVQGADAESSVSKQYWDLEIDAEATVAPASCPNCGAPLDAGELICSHCQTDVRGVVAAPLLVSRLELY